MAVCSRAETDAIAALPFKTNNERSLGYAAEVQIAEEVAACGKRFLQ